MTTSRQQRVPAFRGRGRLDGSLPEPSERWLVAVTEYAGLTEYTGGIGRHYAALLPALVRLGVDVDLVVFADRAPLPMPDLQGVNLVGYYNTGRIDRAALLPLRAFQVRRVYSRRRYHRVFLPEWSALGAGLPRSAPLLTNLATSLRLSHHIAGLSVRELPRSSRIAVTIQNHLEDRQINRSAGVIAISHAMLGWSAGKFDRLPPARVVRNCIDVARVLAASRIGQPPPGWPETDAPVVLFLGRLERRKGVVDAVDAFARVVGRFPGAQLVLAGASGDRRFEPDLPGLLARLPATVRGQVTWLGHVSGDELYRGIRDATVTVCPSRWEGFGNVALEVKAVGAVLVCTAGSGFDDFCVDGEDSLMVPAADPTALGDAICRALGDSDLRSMLGRNAAAGVGRFAPDPVAADLIVAANEILGSPDAGS